MTGMRVLSVEYENMNIANAVIAKDASKISLIVTMGVYLMFL